MKHLLHLRNCLILLTLVCACSNESQSSKNFMASAEMANDPVIYDSSLEQSSQPEIDKLTEAGITIQRKIIKEGTIKFETPDVKKTRDEIVKIVNEYNGYLANDNVTNYTGSTHYNITIRIPANNFDLLLEKISSTAKRIDSKEIKALDVTEEFVDVEARIKAKKEIEARYKELLKQANKVDDILSIEKEIGLLRTDIEAFEGRLKYLNDKVAYSTLSINFYEQREIPPSSFGFGGKISEALYDGWISALWFIIGIANTWPFILMIIFTIYAIRYFRKKRKSKMQQKK